MPPCLTLLKHHGRQQDEDTVSPQSSAEGSESSNAEPLAPTVPEVKKRALDAHDAEDVPSKKVWTLY